MTVPGFEGLAPCVHCGFCLPNCPTYVETGDEADSPRGRIDLMQRLARGELAPDAPTLDTHLDRCLGCLACETVCPSGVSYGHALETARFILSQSRPIPFIARLVNRVMADTHLGPPALGAARAIRPAARWLTRRAGSWSAPAMLAATMPALGSGGRAPSRGGAGVPRDRTADTDVVMFRGCVMAALFDHVHEATERTIEVNGYRVVEAPEQGCCGALHAHTGDRRAAIELARRNVHAFSKVPDGPIVVNAAGCSAMLKEYGTLLESDPLREAARTLADRVRDVTELLADRGPTTGGTVRLRVAYDPPCHLLHAQGIADAPLAVLAAVPGLTRVPHADSDFCCGSAGSYSLTQRELSLNILGRKLDAITAARPDVVATGNPGCIMQIGAGLAARGSHIPVVHPVEILDLSYEVAGHYDHG